MRAGRSFLVLCLGVVLLSPSLDGAPRLEKAFIFGSRSLTCPVFNKPDTNYTPVFQGADNAATIQALTYSDALGWGFDPYLLGATTNPYGTRGAGWQIFGPMDATPNPREKFGDWDGANPPECPLTIYDSFIGGKDFVDPCDSTMAGGDRNMPCYEFDPVAHYPESIIFKVKVPNGKYRFVLAAGDSDNPHTHRFVIEDGGTGGPDNMGSNHIVAVKNFDEGEYCEGAFARVGFGCYIPPPATNTRNTNLLAFVNIGADGLPTGGPPDCPTLEVTQGYIRVHGMKGNSNAGACGASQLNGGDFVLLEIWDVGNEQIPPGVFPGRITRAIAPDVYDVGDPVTVTLTAADVSVQHTIVETIPAGFAIANAGGGTVSGNTITFVATASGQFVYTLQPSGCRAGQISGTVTVQGTICPGYPAPTIAGEYAISCSEGLTFFGGVREFLMVGPIDLGAVRTECFDEGLLDQRDYLTDGTITERNVLASEGQQWEPDFGVSAGGTGVKATPNPSINPNGANGIVTVWRGVGNAQGHCVFHDASNYNGNVEDCVQYALAYLENVTGACLDVVLEIGSDDGMVTLLNGSPIGFTNACRGVPAYGAGDMLPVTLATGKNIVLIKGCNRGTNSGARLVVRKPDRTPITVNDNLVVPSLVPPAAYPSIPTFDVARTIDPSPNYDPGEQISVTLEVTNATAAVRVVETVPWGLTLIDNGGGTVSEDPVTQTRTITFNFTGNGTKTYRFQAPDSPDCTAHTFTGTATVTQGCATAKAVMGDALLRHSPVFPDCIAQPQVQAELVRAFAFGIHPELGTTGRATAWCETPNKPGTPYIAVEQADRLDDMGVVIQAGPAYLAYEGNEARGWGFVTQVTDTATSPWGPRNGWGVFGPMDESPNDRGDFAADGSPTCPEELYDSLIGNKNYQDTRVVGNPDLQCSDLVCPDGDPCSKCDATWPAQGIIFRADVPNGDYRFVMAVGDSDNRHAHRVIAENGGTGVPKDPLIDTAMDAVTLIYNFDQPQWWHGQPEPANGGEGVFARVGFDGRMPPIGDGTAPDPQFVNMDENGMETYDCANSPTLKVTNGYILFHCLQANDTDGCGGARDSRGNGGDLVVLEIWKIGGAPPERFKRGDANRDGGMNIADAVYILQNLFAQGPPILCKDAADSNDDEGVNIADAVYILQNLFAQGPAIPAPGSKACGTDPTGHPTGGQPLPKCEYPADKC